MDTPLYKSFIAIIESGSLSKAAEKLHMAQPALTRHLKLLEKEYGAKLLKTGQGIRHVEVTPAGMILYHKAKYLVEIESQISEEISAYENGTKGVLRLTTSPSVAFRHIQQTLSHFHERNPRIVFDLKECSTEQQFENLMSGVSEIGIANAPLWRPELCTIHLTIEDRMVLFLNKKSISLDKYHIPEDTTKPIPAPLPTLSRILRKFPVCLTEGCHDKDLSFLAELGLTVTPLSVSTTKTAALEWVKNNQAVAIAPVDSQEIIPEPLMAFLLPGSLISNYRTVYSLKSHTLTPLASQFLNFVLVSTGMKI